MIKVDVFTTNNGLILKNLFLSEDKKFVVGKVQNKLLENEYISTKWEINKEKQKCICILNEPLYDFSLQGVYIPFLFTEEKKVVKNFYTFNKNAWHCKLYKWIYGKEPHKVHPTMCPYFWIMFISLIPPIFAIILIIKLFGKTGTSFMSNMSTLRSRIQMKADEKKREKCRKWVEHVKYTYKTLDGPAIKKLYKSDYYDYNSCSLGRVHYEIEEMYYDYKRELQRKESEREEIIDKANRLKELARKEKKQQKTKIVFKQDSKTAKIIGIGLIVVFLSTCLYGLFNLASLAVSKINWVYIGYVLLVIVLGLIAVAFLYVFINKILVPLFKHLIIPVFVFLMENIILKPIKFIYKIVGNFLKFIIVKPIKYTVGKIEENEFTKLKLFFQNIGKFIRFVKKIICYPFVITVKSFIYMFDFFKMCIDLIRQMYKKNCPTITWTDNEDNIN